jgi:2'-5' RNA ligase
MPEKHRLFIASPLGSPLREHLLALCGRRETVAARIPCRCRWVPPEQWHLTWLFLGDVDVSRVPEIQARLAAALSGFRAVQATLEDLALWPNARRANVLVFRMKQTPGLSELYERIRAALPEFKADKPFTPHITLARLKEAVPGGAATFQSEGFQPVEGALGSVVLYRSILGASGAIYRPLWTSNPGG